MPCGQALAAARGAGAAKGVGLGPRSSLGRRNGGRGKWGWCCARRDTRGKRGYDGSKGAGMTDLRVRGGGGGGWWEWRRGSPADRRWRWLGALVLRRGVGFGPQIKSGATDPEVGSGVGAVRGEIPLFKPGAGSAASAGMTDLGARGGEVAEVGGCGCGGRVAGRGVGAVLGEIPAASAGMTDLRARGGGGGGWWGWRRWAGVSRRRLGLVR